MGNWAYSQKIGGSKNDISWIDANAKVKKILFSVKIGLVWNEYYLMSSLSLLDDLGVARILWNIFPQKLMQLKFECKKFITVRKSISLLTLHILFLCTYKKIYRYAFLPWQTEWNCKWMSAFRAFLGCYSETGVHIVMEILSVDGAECRHNWNWSLPVCADLLIYEINYCVFKQY